MEKVRLGIIGIGNMGSSHIRNYLKNDCKVFRRGQDMHKYKHQLFYSNTLSADIIMKKEKMGYYYRNTIMRILKGANKVM